MATKKTEVVADESTKKSLLRRGAMTALKLGGSSALGATVAVVEIEAGETAAKGVVAAGVIVGALVEIFVDPIEHPVVVEGAKITMSSAAGVGTYKRVHKGYSEHKEKKDEQERSVTVAQLRKDMAGQKAKLKNGRAKVGGRLEAPREMVPVPRARERELVSSESGEHQDTHPEG